MTLFLLHLRRVWPDRNALLPLCEDKQRRQASRFLQPVNSTNLKVCSSYRSCVLFVNRFIFWPACKGVRFDNAVLQPACRYPRCPRRVNKVEDSVGVARIILGGKFVLGQPLLNVSNPMPGSLSVPTNEILGHFSLTWPRTCWSIRSFAPSAAVPSVEVVKANASGSAWPFASATMAYNS